MNILLVSTNRSKEIMPCMPVGLACLNPLLGEHSVSLLDLFFETRPEEALEDAMKNIRPQLVGFSIRNVDNQLWSRPEYHLPDLKRYVEIVKRETPIQVVVGGAGYSIFPEAALSYVGADWGMAGDAEESFPLLLRAIESGIEPAGIPGLVIPGSVNEPSILARIEDYGQIPLPAWDDLQWQKYQKQGGSLSILARRGCPYHCIYCDVPAREGPIVKGKSPQRLVAEMEAASQLGMEEVFVADNVFNYPAGYARAVAEEIIHRHVKIKWSATLHPIGIEAEDIRILRHSGFHMASLGPDTGSEEILKNLRKGFYVEDIWRLIDRLKENDIGFYMSIMLGGPGETRSTVEESVRFALKAGATLASFRLGIRITPFTGLHQIAIQEGILTPQDNLLAPKFYISQAILDWIYPYLQENLGHNPHILIQ